MTQGEVRRSARVGSALTIIVAALSLVPACTGSDASTASVTSTTVDAPSAARPAEAITRDGDTYRIPATTEPVVPGQLVASQALPPSAALGGARRTLLLYGTTDAQAAPTVASGVVLAPARTPPPGGWPVVSWAHGTVGVADGCAPSQTDNLAYNEYAQEVRSFLDAGYAVVATDDVGLGTPGIHPYLDGMSEGAATVDIVPAAHRAVTGLAPDWFAVGHSQGGQAVLFANRIAATRAPGYPLRATISIAPASHLELLVPAVASGDRPADFVYALYAIVGLSAADPTVELEPLLGPEGDARVDLITDDGCLIDTGEAFAGVAAADAFAIDDAAMERISEGLARIGNPDIAPTSGPVLILQGATDADVPAEFSAAVAERLRALGSDVTYREYPDLGHDEVLGPSMCEQLAFLAAHGGPTVSDCIPQPTDLS
jgi:pimeloyl-ACP methyl ester carboxylesterase